MKFAESLSALWADRVSRWGIITTLLLLGVLIALLIWFIPPSPNAQALHYNIYFGIDLFGPGRALWLNPTAGFFVLLLNVVIASYALERQAVAARLAIWAAALFAAIVLAATVLISTIIE